MAFDFPTKPAWWRTVSWDVPYGIFYPGTQPYITFAAGCTADHYRVYDYWGSLVSSGTFSGDTCTPTPPARGWVCGWYRVHFTGPNSDANYGTSYGATCFVVLRDDQRFPKITASWPTFSGGESRDQPIRGVLGLGGARLQIGDAANLSAAPDTLAECQTDLARVKEWSQPSSPYVDPVRGSLRRPWLQFPGETVDNILITGPGGAGGWLRVYAKDETVNSSMVWVSVAAGTSAGSKVTVCYPDSGTVAETFDNLANATVAATTINAGSSKVVVFTADQAQPAYISATNIGRTRWNGVVTVVSTLYPDVTCYEGPSNESVLSREAAHRMRLYAAAVHAGNAAAKAIGPCAVSVRDVAAWTAFLDAGGGNWCDEIASHWYNTFEMGTLTARPIIEAFLALLTHYGLQDKPRWDTESCNALVPLGGVYHPRMAGIVVLYSLLQEQYGMPRERCPWWYDRSHGYWSYPTWFINSDSSLNPQAALLRVLAEETFGMLHDQRLTFCPMGEKLFLGSVFRASSGAGVVALIANSAMPDSSITLNVTGATGALTVVDAFGNESTVAVQAGRVTVPVTDVPTYVRVQAGVTVSVYRCRDWPVVGTVAAGRMGTAERIPSLSGSPMWELSDHTFLSDYYDTAHKGTQLVKSPTVGAAEAVIRYEHQERVDRVLIFSLRPPAYNGVTTPVTLAVDSSTDGTTWVEQWTYTNQTATSIQFRSAHPGTNCLYDTWFDWQWIFDAKFLNPVTCKALRVRITPSVGSECDSATAAASLGAAEQRVMLMEIATLCDDNTTPHYVRST